MGRIGTAGSKSTLVGLGRYGSEPCGLPRPSRPSRRSLKKRGNPNPKETLKKQRNPFPTYAKSSKVQYIAAYIQVYGNHGCPCSNIWHAPPAIATSTAYQCLRPDHLMLINPLTLILRRWSEPLDVDSGRCSVPLIQLDSFWRGIY